MLAQEALYFGAGAPIFSIDRDPINQRVDLGLGF